MYIILRETAPAWRRVVSVLTTVAAVVQAVRTFRALAARSQVEEDEDEDALDLRSAEQAYLNVTVFLHGCEDQVEVLDAPRLAELRRLRQVFLAGAWSLTGLDRKAWNGAGIEEPAMAVRLSTLGVRPSALHAPLTDEEGAAVTAACGWAVSAATPVELLDERRIDGPAMVAWLAERRQHAHRPVLR